MSCAHTSSQDWQAAADLLGEAALAHSFDEIREHSVLPLHRLFRSDFVTYDRWDNQGRMLSYRAHPDPGATLAALVEPFAAFIHEHPMIPIWSDVIERGKLMQLSELMPVGKFLRTGLWNEVYIHQGTKYQLAFGGRIDAASTWTIACGRLPHDFGPRERELSKFLQPRLSRITSSIARRDRAGRIADALRGFFARADTAYFFATVDFRVLEISDPARRWLASAVPGGMPLADRLPAACAELCAVLARNNSRVVSTVAVGSLQALVLRLALDGTSLVILQNPASNGAPDARAGLTRREAEILGWLSEGKTNTEIAALLGISPRTVEKHCENLFAKLGVESRLGAALLGRRHPA